MATVGHGFLSSTAHSFFDAVRSYDAAAAVATLHEHVVYRAPWAQLEGRDAVEQHLASWLGDPQRPSFTISNLAGSGTRIRFDVSVSGRFGHNPARFALSLLVHKNQIHQVDWSPIGAAAGHS